VRSSVQKRFFKETTFANKKGFQAGSTLVVGWAASYVTRHAASSGWVLNSSRWMVHDLAPVPVLSQPHTAAPFSPRSPRMPPTVPGAGEGSGARQQLHISSKQLRQRRPWFSPRTAFIAEAKVLIMHPTAALGPLPDNTHAPPNHPAVPVHRRSTGGATLDGHRREFDAVRGACARLEQAPAPTLARCIVP
jgi:hypothetical protein